MHVAIQILLLLLLLLYYLSDDIIADLEVYHFLRHPVLEYPIPATFTHMEGGTKQVSCGHDLSFLHYSDC